MDTMVPEQASAQTKKPMVTLCITSALFAFLTFICIVGSLLFSYPLGGIVGWSTGIGLDIAGVLMAYCAFKLPAGEVKAYRVGLGVMAAFFCWSFYKVFIYHESESTLFFVVTVVAIVLLLRPSVRRYHAELAS